MNWLNQAQNDLREIGLYIAERSSIARGERIVREIAATADILRDHPLAGPVIDEDVAGRHRHLICYSYRIIYRVDAEVSIIAVVYGARLLPPGLMSRQ